MSCRFDPCVKRSQYNAKRKVLAMLRREFKRGYLKTASVDARVDQSPMAFTDTYVHYEVPREMIYTIEVQRPAPRQRKAKR